MQCLISKYKVLETSYRSELFENFPRVKKFGKMRSRPDYPTQELAKCIENLNVKKGAF